MRLSAVLCSSVLVCTAFLTGCTLHTTAADSLAQGVALQGRVHGGQQPIAGAHIYLMAANTTGYGDAAVSLLNGAVTQLSDSVGAYVLTDAQGGFSITGDYNCSANQQVYLLAVGGNPGAGVNQAAALMAVLGQCPSSNSNFLAADPYISVNEVTTVAGVYALSGYMTDMLHVSSSGTALSNIGMANAFLTAANLADISSGSALATTPAGNGTAPQAKVNTIANILAACIDSDGTVVSAPVPTTCYTLFSNATSDGTSSGTVPTETVTAALNIAHNPGTNNVANLNALQTGAAPFQPSTSPIYDFALLLNFTGGGIVNPARVAVDSFGNIWTANRASATAGNSVSKLAAGTGAPLSPAGTGYTGGGINLPTYVAIDSSNNVWIGGTSSGSMADGIVSKLAEDGTPVSATGYDLGVIWNVTGMAIDSLGNAYVGMNGPAYKVDGGTGAVTQVVSSHPPLSFSLAVGANNVVWLGTTAISPGVEEVDNTGTILFPTATNPSLSGSTGGLSNPIAMAVDHAGNVWACNGGTSGSSQFFGVAKFSSNGTLLSPPNNSIPGQVSLNTAGYAPYVEPTAIVIDGAGHVFVLNMGSLPSFVELNNDGTQISPANGYFDTSVNETNGIAVDGSGNLWISNYLNSSLTEFVGMATPVVTPIAAGVANNTLGTRP